MAKAVAFNELLVMSKLCDLPEDQYMVRPSYVGTPYSRTYLGLQTTPGGRCGSDLGT